MSKRGKQKRAKERFLKELAARDYVEKPARSSNGSAALYKKVNSEWFLLSPEWRALRARVISHYGRRCMCCGITPENKRYVNVDHIKPRRLYPELALVFDNLQVLCSECNKAKGNRHATDYRPILQDIALDALDRFVRQTTHKTVSRITA